MGVHKDISVHQKEEIVQYLLMHLKNGKPARGEIMEAAALFNLCRKTVSRVWKAAMKQKERGEVIKVNKTLRGSKQKYKVDVDQIEQVNYQKRGTIRSLADSLHVSKSTVGRWVKDKLIRSHTNAIKPELTAPNKLLRLSFSLQAIEYDNASSILRFKSMDNVVHIDEKWFYLTKDTHRYYMTHREQEPHRYCKSKKFIPKVMFMCAVCRPIFSENGDVLFDGKIGIWPFTELVTAKRNSKNRAAGSLEVKPIESITKQVIKDCLLKQIVPAIKEKWPDFLSRNIYIQQDNAKPHINDSDPDFRAIASSDGFNIKLVQQPANSPDLNVNDLGFFRAIQSLQQQQACKNAEELVQAVLSSFNTLEPMKLNKVFLSLQSCMQEILKVKGCNNYKLPHIKKDAMTLHNELPRSLEVPMQLVKDSIEFLKAAGCKEDGFEQLIDALGCIQVKRAVARFWDAYR